MGDSVGGVAATVATSVLVSLAVPAVTIALNRSIAGMLVTMGLCSGPIGGHRLVPNQAGSFA